jgi:hypothetical protein
MISIGFPSQDLLTLANDGNHSGPQLAAGELLDRRSEAHYFGSMNFGVLFEEIKDEDFPPGYYYAHLPRLGFTTHGLGLDGARRAALDLAQVWLAEKKAPGEALPAASEILFSILDFGRSRA